MSADVGTRAHTCAPGKQSPVLGVSWGSEPHSIAACGGARTQRRWQRMPADFAADSCNAADTMPPTRKALRILDVSKADTSEIKEVGFFDSNPNSYPHR
jgi:hypothetical protein